MHTGHSVLVVDFSRIRWIGVVEMTGYRRTSKRSTLYVTSIHKPFRRGRLNTRGGGEGTKSAGVNGEGGETSRGTFQWKNRRGRLMPKDLRLVLVGGVNGSPVVTERMLAR